MCIRDSVDVLRDAEVDDELDVRVVVDVRAAGHLDELVGAADKLRVRGEVLGRRHDDKLDGALVAKRLVAPVADRHDRLGGGHAVVRDEERRRSELLVETFLIGEFRLIE